MKTNKIIYGDCLKVLPTFPDDCIDLSFSDIPFNINLSNRLESRNSSYNKTTYEDNLSEEEYYTLLHGWIIENYRILKSSGTLVIMSGWTNLGIVFDALKEIDFNLLNHCIIKYPWGIYTKNRFVSSHYHVLFLTKSDTYTFNKQKKYDEDVWIMKREYQSKKIGHPCPTTPEWIQKIILTSSNEGDVVLDAFFGTGMTGLVAEKLGRRWIGIEINKEFYDISTKLFDFDLRQRRID